MTLTSETGNVLMLSKELKQTSYEGEKKLEGSISVGVGNQYVDTGYAAKAVVDAEKVVEEANKKLREIKGKEKEGKASSNAVKDAELNLALASANLAQATASLATSIASSGAAASSSLATGMYADVSLNLSGHENRTYISETRTMAAV
jgi:hypothetical protein